jgi:excisionase family DNA binding protein
MEVTNVMAIPVTRVRPTERFAYSINEACQMLSLGRTSLYEMAKNGELKLIRIAGRTLVPLSEIERLTAVDRKA